MSGFLSVLSSWEERVRDRKKRTISSLKLRKVIKNTTGRKKLETVFHLEAKLRSE
jgi:hypothetical protein